MPILKYQQIKVFMSKDKEAVFGFFKVLESSTISKTKLLVLNFFAKYIQMFVKKILL